MNKINLVPKAYKQSFKRKWYIGGGILGGVLVLVLVSFLVSLPIRQIRLAQEEQVDLDLELNSSALSEVKDMIDEAALVAKEKEAIEANLEEITQPSQVSRGLMDIILANAPEGIRINQISMDESSASTKISGQAISNKNLAQYMMSLYQTKQFEDISYTSSQNSDPHISWKTDYTISIQLKSSQAEEDQMEEEAQDLDQDELDEAGGDETL